MELFQKAFYLTHYINYSHKVSTSQLTIQSINGHCHLKMEKKGYEYLPQSFKNAIKVIKGSTLPLEVAMKIIPNFKTKEEEIVFLYFVLRNMNDISASCRCSKNRVQRTIKEFLTNKTIPKPLPIGRPKILNEDILVEICSKLLDNPHCSIREIRNSIFEKLGVTCSRGLIGQAIHKLRFQYKPPKARQMLTQIQKQMRVEFSYSALTSLDRFDNIMFSDESRFCFGSDCRWVWRRRGEYPEGIFRDKSKFQQGVMVFGAISKGFKSDLVFCENSIGSSEYVRILSESKLFEKADATLGNTCSCRMGLLLILLKMLLNGFATGHYCYSIGPQIPPT